MAADKAAQKQAIAEYEQKNQRKAEVSVAPENQGVTKKEAERMLKRLHKSNYRIPASLKI